MQNKLRVICLTTLLMINVLLAALIFTKGSEAYTFVHPYIPRTKVEDLTSCHKVLKTQELFDEAITCVSASLPKASEINKLPRCYVLSDTSGDVKQGQKFNFINLLGVKFVLGFYEPVNKTIYLVSDPSNSDTYKHEVQHYILDLLLQDADAAHSNIIWSTCEEAHYSFD